MQRDYKRTVDEDKLFNLSFEKFNKPGALYMDRMAPVLLTQFLRERDPHLPREIVHDIRLTKRRVPEPENPLTKITFSPFGLSKLPLATVQRPKLHAEKVKGKPIDIGYRVECEIPTYLLQKILPLHLFDTGAAHPPASKRKVGADVAVEKVEKSAPKAKKSRPMENLGFLGTTLPSKSNKQIVEPPIETPLEESGPELRQPMPRKRPGKPTNQGNSNTPAATSLKPNIQKTSKGKSSAASASIDFIDLTDD